MSPPWGSEKRTTEEHIERYWIMDDSGDRYGDSWNENVPYKVTDRYNHTSNPPDASGFRGPSNYLVSEYLYDTKYGNWNWQGIGRREFFKGRSAGWIGDHVGTAGPCMDGLSLQADPNLRARALSECLVKLGDVKTNVLQNLATATQTASLLSDATHNLASALAAARRGNIGFLTTIAGRLYLQYQYGWKPLVDDCMGALSLLLDSTLAPTVYATRRVSDSRQMEREERGYRWTSSYQTQSTCKIWAQVDNTWAHGAHQAGADITNVPWMLWDLVPWSFAVDWVLPVGNVLEALGATAGLNFKAGYRSDRVTANADVTLVPSDNVIATSDFGGRFTGRWYRRESLSGFPLPEPYVKSPFTATHALEALALLRTMR